MCTGSHYLGVSFGGGSKCDWLEDRTSIWECNIHMVNETVGKHPRESYSAVLRVIQSEWVFLKCVTRNTGDAFIGVDKLIW